MPDCLTQSPDMHWDEVAKRERLIERLRKLSKAKVISFAGGCAAHVLERFQREQELQAAPFMTATADALKGFWCDFHSHPQEATRQVLILQPLIPDDDAGDEDAFLPGRYDLVMAAICACECVERPDAQKAFDAAAHAYQAIYDLELRPNEISRAEPELGETERVNATCRDEIAFQFGYLTALEQLPIGSPVDFSTVRQLLTR